MGFEKAKLKIYKEKEETMQVLFNPAEYNLSENANYAEQNIPGFNAPITQYVSGQASTLTLTLMFDSYETAESEASGNVAAKSNSGTPVKPWDVTKMTKKITELTKISGSLHRPPLCEFIWGPLHFKGVITAVNQTFTMFMEDGMPVRAKLDVTFKAVTESLDDKKISPFESPDRSKYRVVKQGSDLWRLAWEEYGDPEMWRVIAKANGLLNPRDLQVGQRLKLPAI
jgi:hypothetical protein